MSDIKIHQTNVLTQNIDDLSKNGFDVEFTGDTVIIKASGRDKIVVRAGELTVVNYEEEKIISDRWIKPTLQMIQQEFSM